MTLPCNNNNQKISTSNKKKKKKNKIKNKKNNKKKKKRKKSKAKKTKMCAQTSYQKKMKIQPRNLIQNLTIQEENLNNFLNQLEDQDSIRMKEIIIMILSFLVEYLLILKVKIHTIVLIEI